ncbi:MAG: helix-turn-helix domain-containing protein [Actinomycetota bacterium]|nr:helix-turn-helix domain-containing protein [Actinomycetota bacterium]
MSEQGLAAALLDSLDNEALAALADRLRPHLTDAELDGNRLLDPREAAARLGLHERTVARMAREGRIPGAMKIGKGWRFPADRLATRPPLRPVAGGDGRPAQARRTPGRASVAAIRGLG